MLEAWNAPMELPRIVKIKEWARKGYGLPTNGWGSTAYEERCIGPDASRFSNCWRYGISLDLELGETTV